MSKNNSPSDQIRLLLALFHLGSQNVPKSQWLNLFKYKSERIGDMQPIVTSLEQEGAIEILSNKSIQKVSLLPKGQRKLQDGLFDNQLVFPSSIVSAKFVKALMLWLHTNGAKIHASDDHLINSYTEFKQTVLHVYEKLNLDYKFGDLVPIYRIRRQIGDIVEHQNFDQWLLEMQADDILQLLEGSVEDSAPDKLADSIRTQLSGLRCYARKL
jgi:hypothetical protein